MATDYQLYALTVPEATRNQSRARSQTNVTVQGLLNGDLGVAKPTSSDPTEQALTATYAGKYSEKMATEVRELAINSTIDSVPLSGVQSQTPLDGYYAVERATIEPRSPQSRRLNRVDVSLREQDTRASAYRTVETTRVQVDNPFGNTTNNYVAVPAAASDIQWLDPETKTTSDPTAVATRSAELGDVLVYDTADGPTTNPSLVYDLAYADHGPTDVRVWDERGEGSKLDGDGALQWSKVFSTAREFQGEGIIDTGLLRLRLSSSLAAESWDDVNSQWTTTSLGTSDYALRSWDVRDIGLAQVRVRMTFADRTQSPTDTRRLDAYLGRGYESVVFDEVDAAPSGLVDLLDPIASDRIYQPNAALGLTAREEVD